MALTMPALQAQQDAKAKKILDAVSQKFTTMKAFEASFKQSIVEQNDAPLEAMSGKLTIKGEKYFLDMGEQTMLFDGASNYLWVKEFNEVTIEEPDPELGLTPSKLYTIYQSGYKYIYLREETYNGAAHHVIDLIPEDRGAEIFKIRLRINKAQNTISNWEMFERTGNKYLIEVTSIKPRPNLPDSFFEFKEANYPDANIEDLRG